MHLLYVDASGTPNLNDPQNALFTLLGVCVHEGTWYGLESRVAGLKRRFSAAGAQEFELHALEFCTRFKLQEQIADFAALTFEQRLQAYDQALANLTEPGRKQKEAKAQRPWAHLTRAERSALLEATLDLIGDHAGLTLFVEAVDKPYLFKQTGKKLALEDAMMQIVSRFDAFLHRKNESYLPEKGLIIIDAEHAHERDMREMFADWRRRGHRWGKIRHVIESPFFVDSSVASGVQLADIAAYATRRYLERASSPKAVFESENFQRIFHVFDRAGPRLHGARHYCNRGCQCVICMATQRSGDAHRSLPGGD